MIRTLGPRDQLSYYDSQSVELVRPVAPLEAWNIIMASPQPVLRAAFAVRDAISARFGVKRIGGFTGARVGQVAVGDYLDFFLVEEATPEHLVLTERDRHLDVMTCVSCEGARLSITSSVVTHNLFGRAYMLPVGIAHKVIVRGMLDRLARAVAA
jgi:hypothetical protein